MTVSDDDLTELPPLYRATAAVLNVWPEALNAAIAEPRFFTDNYSQTYLIQAGRRWYVLCGLHAALVDET